MAINIPVLLESVRSNEGFRESVKTTFPDIKKEVDGFFENPRCKCRNAIIHLFREGISKEDETVLKFIEGWKDSIDNLEIHPTNKPVTIESAPESVNRTNGNRNRHPHQNINTRRRMNAENSKRGSVIQIPAEPQAFKDLISVSDTEGWYYESVSVMETERDGKNVWLVFFA